MFGHFEVGAVDCGPDRRSASTSGGGGSGTTGKAGTRIAATLLADVDARGNLRLILDGKAVKALAPGSYRIVVADSSLKRGVTLQRVGGAATTLTAAPFVGRRTVTMQLAAGSWKLAAPPAKAIVFRVAKS